MNLEYSDKTYEGVDKEILINCYGPFSHGVWKNKNKSLGNEEALEGRSNAIVDNFCETILKIYSENELSKLTFCDIGCYDGYLTCEIAKRLKFKRIVGYEPRLKNIEKGLAARAYLDIKTDVDFKQGDIRKIAIEGKNFDIVFVSGVFHHIQNIPDIVKDLSLITKQYLYVESQCYSNLLSSWNPIRKIINNFNLKVIEPKDIIYNFWPKNVAVSGSKIETNFYDGSCNDAIQTVTIPSPEYLLMICDIYGFKDSKVTLSPRAYSKKFKSNLRDFRAVCLITKKSNENKANDYANLVKNIIFKYESESIINLLNKKILLHLSKKGFSIRGTAIRYLLKQSKFRIFQSIKNQVINLMGTKSQVRILKNIKYKPIEKIEFEISKYMLFNGNVHEATKKLEKLITIRNCDWRICYRSLALLSLIMKKNKDEINFKKYKKLCLLANPNLPDEIFNLKI